MAEAGFRIPAHRRVHRRVGGSPRTFFCVCAMVLAVIAVTIASAGTGWASDFVSTGPVVVDSLSIAPSDIGPDSTVAAVAVVHAPHDITLQALTIAVRSADRANYDFRGAISATLGEASTTFTPDRRTFPAGAYTYFVAYKIGGIWHNLAPVKSFDSTIAHSDSTPASSPTASGTAPPPMAGGTLVFSDEFDENGLDTAKWTANWLGAPGEITPPANSAETGCYDPAQVVVRDGEADLSAVARSCAVGGKNYAYRSGMIQSDGGFRFAHGYAEARIWTPPGSGMWPAFWLDGQSWPADGEIDVLEAYGTDYSTFHYHFTGGVRGGGTNLADATAGWHTYAVDWTGSSTTWYYDGSPVYSTATQTNSPMYLILDLGLYSTDSAVPATMRVDYVRVWQ